MTPNPLRKTSPASKSNHRRRERDYNDIRNNGKTAVAQAPLRPSFLLLHQSAPAILS